jgi:hypothetical protein
VSGSAVAAGTLRFDKNGVTGTLAGRHIKSSY